MEHAATQLSSALPRPRRSLGSVVPCDVPVALVVRMYPFPYLNWCGMVPEREVVTGEFGTCSTVSVAVLLLLATVYAVEHGASVLFLEVSRRLVAICTTSRTYNVLLSQRSTWSEWLTSFGGLVC